MGLEGAADGAAVRALLARTRYVFWAGDLNYRVALDRPEADAFLAAGDLEVGWGGLWSGGVLFEKSGGRSGGALVFR